MKTKTSKTRSIVFYFHPSPPKRTISEYAAFHVVGPKSFFRCYIRGVCSPLECEESLANARPRSGETLLNSVDVV